MCGIVGFFSPSSSLSFQTVLYRMTEAITHRGPDSEGHWYDEQCGIGLGHRRLSILDLSPAGHQPMASVCGRYVIAFNGEIYNHLALREQLENKAQAPNWHGHSDTETLLAAVSTWGLEQTLKTVEGMFAIALWDRKTNTLTLARDRFGEKPLYYGYPTGEGKQSTFLFASELKAMTVHPEWQGVLEPAVLECYLRFGYVQGSTSIFRNIVKLPAGSLLTLSPKDMQMGHTPASERWWLAEEAALSAMQEGQISDTEAGINIVEKALVDSVSQRMTADVPVGAFLSGGIDSSLIVALMQQETNHPVRTFSVGFDDPRYDESKYAEAVAGHLGTLHTTLQASSQMALDLVPKLPELYDEPFADSSQLPTALISNLTRSHVKVALSGDGGDELFGGYNRHLWVPEIWKKLKYLPLSARRAVAASLKAIPSHTYDRLIKAGSQVFPKRFQIRTFGEKLHKLADVLASSSEQALFSGVVSMNPNPSRMLLEQADKGGAKDPLFPILKSFNSLEWMLLTDTLHYMVDDVLVKVDRASMASSLEVRVPFLNSAVFHAAWRLAPELKIRKGQSKWLLRQILYRYIPPKLLERPKMGFAIPLDSWLRGPLKTWAEDLLKPDNFAEFPMLNTRQVGMLWQNHIDRKENNAQKLWVVLQLLAWQRRWRARIV